MSFRTHGLDVSEIHPGLYQGSLPPFGDVLAKKGFDVLVLCAEENQHDDFYFDIHTICAPGEDNEDPEVLTRCLPTWILAAQRVAQQVKLGKKVLVTCMAGLNRSGMVTAMALHLLTGKSGADCVAHIQSCRDHALFNSTFVRFLTNNLDASDEPRLPSST